MLHVAPFSTVDNISDSWLRHPKGFGQRGLCFPFLVSPPYFANVLRSEFHPDTTSGVGSWRNCFQVDWVDAAPISTQVIDLEARWNRAVDVGPHHPMGQGCVLFPTSRVDPVSSAHHAALPDPATLSINYEPRLSRVTEWMIVFWVVIYTRPIIQWGQLLTMESLLIVSLTQAFGFMRAFAPNKAAISHIYPLLSVVHGGGHYTSF